MDNKEEKNVEETKTIEEPKEKEKMKKWPIVLIILLLFVIGGIVAIKYMYKPDSNNNYSDYNISIDDSDNTEINDNTLNNDENEKTEDVAKSTAFIQYAKSIAKAIELDSLLPKGQSIFNFSTDCITNTENDVTNTLRLIADVNDSTVTCKQENNAYKFIVTGTNSYAGEVVNIDCNNNESGISCSVK